MSISQLPIWIWGLIFALLFFLFVISIYHASRGASPKVSVPPISLKQLHTTGGIMKTPGVL